MGQQIESALRQSMHRVVVVLVSFLPGVLVFLVAVVILTALGFLFAAIARRILVALRFDERLASNETTGAPSSFSDWSPSHSPTLFVTRAVLWICILAGIAIGISAVDAYLTHVLGAILLLFFGNLLARFLARSILIGAVNAQLQYARFLSLGVKWLVLVLAAAMALDHLQIGGVIIELAFGIMFGGIVLTLSLAIGLGSRDLVSRSIEKTIEKPSTKPTEPTLFPESAEAPRPKLRHF